MNRAFKVLLVFGLAGPLFWSGSWAAPLNKADVYYMRKAFCEKEAAAMHFGVHRIKQHRYIKKCLVESHK